MANDGYGHKLLSREALLQLAQRCLELAASLNDEGTHAYVAIARGYIELAREVQ